VINSSSLALASTLLSATTARVVGTGMAVNTTEQASALIVADGELLVEPNSGLAAWIELVIVVNGVSVRTLRTTASTYLLGNITTGWHVHELLPIQPGSSTVHVEARVLARAGGATVTARAGRLSVVLLRP
jgi:hypothetical protein